MPLIAGNTPDIITANVRELKRSGKFSHAQAVAIAMKSSRKKLASVAKKVAKSDSHKVKGK